MDSGGTPRLVLVVEDHDDTREMMCVCLELSGFLVADARTGAEALARLSSISPDVVTIDIGLPGMSGLEVARRIRQHPATRTVPIIAITGWAFPEDVARAREAGCDAVVRKPCEGAELVAEIRRLLAGRSSG